MTLPRLRRLVEEQLGAGLSDATPANVRRFLDALQGEMEPGLPRGQRYDLDESRTRYDEIMRRFFWDALHGDAEQAVVPLWILGAEAYLTVDADRRK